MSDLLDYDERPKEDPYEVTVDHVPESNIITVYVCKHHHRMNPVWGGYGLDSFGRFINKLIDAFWEIEGGEKDKAENIRKFSRTAFGKHIIKHLPHKVDEIGATDEDREGRDVSGHTIREDTGEGV